MLILLKQIKQPTQEPDWLKVNTTEKQPTIKSESQIYLCKNAADSVFFTWETNKSIIVDKTYNVGDGDFKVVQKGLSDKQPIPKIKQKR